MSDCEERREQLKEKLKSRLISNMNESEKQVDCEPEDLSMRCHQMKPSGVPDSPVNVIREPIQHPDTVGNKGALEGIHGRKLIGIRYLFPQFPDNISLLERTRIWVARHDYGYFVSWTQNELQQVDQILRPIQEVSLELYKKHMNRSEYCRNVKLKYCLESDSPWAQDFREKLSKDYQHGGFKGLCEVKQAAAELWRNHSDRYRGNQARYPNPKSKYKGLGLTQYTSEKRRLSDDLCQIQKRPRFQTDIDGTLSGETGNRSNVSSPAVSNSEYPVNDQLDTRRPRSAEGTSQYKGHYVLPGRTAKKDINSKHRKTETESYAKILNQTIEKLCIENEEKEKMSEATYPKHMDEVSSYKNMSPQSSLSSYDSGIDVPGTESSRPVQAGRLTEPSCFAPLPERMSVQERMDIWLERHSRSYFVNVSASDLELVPHLLRPIKCLTSANLDDEISTNFRDAIKNYADLKSLNCSMSSRFMEALKLDREKGGFSSVPEALMEGLSVQMVMNATKKKSDDHAEEFDEALADSWAREARKQLYLGQGEEFSGYSHSNMPQSPSQGDSRTTFGVHSLPSSTFEYNLTTSATKPARVPLQYSYRDNNVETPYLYRCRNDIKGTTDTWQPPKRPDEEAFMPHNMRQFEPYETDFKYSQNIDSKAIMAQNLWSYRSHLHNLCKDDSKLSWKQKLEPFLPVIKHIGGFNYEIPDTTNECIVDMVLAVLHSAILDQC